jgi:hypothetical protein
MTDRSPTKRRALVARLLACVVPVCLLAAASASAAPPVLSPTLVTTDPPSSAMQPAQSLTPTIIGEAEPEDIVIIESVPFEVDFAPNLVTRKVEHGTEHPEFTIKIFSGVGCTPGMLVAEGTAKTFEETGIPLTVSPDSSTTFSALQEDPTRPGEPSACSNPLIYWEGSVLAGGESGGESQGESSNPGGGPQSTGASSTSGSIGTGTPAGGKPPAPRIHTQPGPRSNVSTPFILGSAPKADTVAVYANGDCSGAPVAKGSPTELSSGFQIPVAPNAETVFSAVSIGTQHSGCSEPVTYTEDSTAPRTRVTMAPGVKTRKRNATFRFKDVTADPPGTTFVCKVDQQKWKRCASPFHANHLTLGAHMLRIRATDLAGNVERHPVKRTFRVVPAA